VFAGDQHVAAPEVKALESTALVVTPEELATGDLIPGALQRDNSAGRVATKIHEAVQQFDGVSLAKVLVLFNDDVAPDKFDLQEALRGFLSTEDGERISTMPRSAQLRAQEDRSRIDLYVWVDGSSDEAPSLVTATSVGRDLKSRYFVRPVSGVAGQRRANGRGCIMSEYGTLALVLSGMVGVPQVLGFAASRMLRRVWLWPPAAALIFGVGWYVMWLIPTRAHEAAGERVCGAAGALLIVPLLVLIPVHLFIAGVAQSLLSEAEARSRRSLSGNPALRSDGRVSRCAPSRVRR
jgi:hypothetical protein